MVKSKSKSGGLTRLPKDQRCQLLIGPVSSWFMPISTDIWTPPRRDSMYEDNLIDDDRARLSYFAYGSIGCFCYGEVYNQINSRPASNQIATSDPENRISARINRLFDVKDDNSRVVCIRFLRDSPHPILIALTENGALLIHNCLTSENLIHFKRADVLARLSRDLGETESASSQPMVKKTKFNISQQINSCTWPNPENVFLGISLLQKKTCLVLWIKFKNVIGLQTSQQDLVESCHQFEVATPKDYTSPICLMESIMLDSQTCLIAVAMDDGPISVLKFNLVKGQVERTITTKRHRRQICSMSLFTGKPKLFPSGLLASISRDGDALIWDLETEFHFAEYQCNSGRTGTRVDWFSLSFVHFEPTKHIYLAVSTQNSGIISLQLPEKIQSKSQLKEKPSTKQSGAQTVKHTKVIFNIRYEPITQTIISSSLDGNHILWSTQEMVSPDAKTSPLQVTPRFLYPSMSNEARTHMLRHSPIRENLLGMALGKAGVRFYKITQDAMDCRFDMMPSCENIAKLIAKAGVSPTSLDWHPTNEYHLAIGTIEGKVFKADITPRKATLIEAQHKPISKETESEILPMDATSERNVDADDIFGVAYKPLERSSANGGSSGSCKKNHQQNKLDGIYSLCWGPDPASPHDLSKQGLYAVGSISHRLFIYKDQRGNCDKMSNYLDEFLDQSLPEACGEASEVSWKSSMDLMALGTRDGRVIIVSYLEESHAARSANMLFRRIAVIQGPLGQTYIQCLAWHPTIDKEDSQYYSIAVSANGSPAYVFNLKETVLVAEVRARLKIENAASGNGYRSVSGDKFFLDTEGSTNLLSAYVNKLDAHKGPISDISWSPHAANKLATASFDSSCLVWSLDQSCMEAQICAKFQARERLFTLNWSLVDSDLIFTSGHDSTIWAWRPSENRGVA